MIHEFPAQNWKKCNLCNLIKPLDDNGEIDRKKGNGRPCSVRTAANIRTVGGLICSQEVRLNTSKGLREIERETCIS